MTPEEMKRLVLRHVEREEHLDVEGTLATLVDHPVYEFYPIRLKLEGKENVRQFYEAHFAQFFPMIASHKAVSETWIPDRAFLEYDVKLQDDPSKTYRILVVLNAADSRLLGEKFFGEDKLAKLMCGPAFDRLSPMN